ncbi:MULTISPECIES: hypothetical protein [unclassified Methylobacterium]|uniref:hypothetical protein n=1 Tax=unclassified Methylobacterium TaxID=2615210 RepID=UPI000324F58E|nr:MULTISPECIES: hypothetical protein [Methylobacterium]WFT79573.1 hypothetical protein QA634_30925 [Methylobacterium nodulans]
MTQRKEEAGARDDEGSVQEEAMTVLLTLAFLPVLVALVLAKGEIGRALGWLGLMTVALLLACSGLVSLALGRRGTLARTGADLPADPRGA